MSELIFAYTRKEAISDGVLRDVSTLAREAGFRFPVAVTSGVWEECVTVPQRCPWQDETGRLWDVLNVLRVASRSAAKQSTVSFTVLIQNDEHGPKPTKLRAVCGPGDDAEPVITIMLPDED